MSGNFEVCPVGTLQRLAQVEADLRSMRLCFEVTELERSKYKAEREALLALIADDAFAAAFHTIYWYQRALLKSAKGGGNG